MPCILNYSTLNEKKHCPEAAEPHGALHLSNLLYEASKLCEVNNEADSRAVFRNQGFSISLVKWWWFISLCRDLVAGHWGNSLSWHMPLLPIRHAAMLLLSCIHWYRLHGEKSWSHVVSSTLKPWRLLEEQNANSSKHHVLESPDVINCRVVKTVSKSIRSLELG